MGGLADKTQHTEKPSKISLFEDSDEHEAFRGHAKGRRAMESEHEIGFQS